MATSGSTDFILQRDQAITMALRKLGVLASGSSASTNQISDATLAIQAVCKALNADGMPLWKIDTVNFSTVASTSSYSIGTGLTINVPKPLKIVHALVTPSDSSPIPMDPMTRYDFLGLNSSSTGLPTSYSYSNDRTTGSISVWPTPDGVYTITLLYQSPIEDLDNSTDELDFPAEWMLAVVYMLAWTLAPEYGTPILDRQQLQKEAEYWHQYALSIGAEEGSIRFVPDQR